MSKALPSQSNELDHKDDISAGQAAKAFGARIRERAGILGLTSAEIGRLAGIKKQSMAGYWAGDRLCGSDKLFALADALHCGARWLVSGEEPRSSNPLTDASQADWVMVPEYDLRELSDEGKGEPRSPSPFRRDWLNQTLGAASGLWLTRMLSDYRAMSLAEDTLVFCMDVTPAELLEGQLCLFRVNGGLITAQFSFQPRDAIAANDVGRLYVTSAEIGHEDNRYWPVARILGRFIGRL